MKRHEKKTSRGTAVMMLTFIYLIFIVNLSTPSKMFSESENRKLELLPSFAIRHLLSGKFTANYEKYISDQFMQRDVWIGIKSAADRMMGKKESNGVYLGRDGYLLQKFSPPPFREPGDKAEALNRLAEAVPGINTYVMLVPTALSVLSDKLPDHVSGNLELEEREHVRQRLNKDIRYVDVYPVLHAKRSEPLFYRTDHHWTTKGAFYAYQELSRNMGFSPKEESRFTITRVTDSFYGTLYSKSGFRHVKPDSMELYLPKFPDKYAVKFSDKSHTTNSLYERDYLQRKDKYALFMGGNHSLVAIKTGIRDGRKLLVIKDSYANSLIPFLTSHFSEIYVVDPRYYEGDLRKLANAHKIQDVLVLYNLHTFFEDVSFPKIAAFAK
ncbi:DHHW family protein [Paenibacillus sp. DMB20]|uniref:DHHW family protein n=1 Tax=Paenibacillus sp. DMB20 TaxID=1642570 RepID=UPI000627C3F0|nr:DHHW family protein [Paenibacillus sp. DMB20]KKO52479.1 hypothetical protein XI25_20135 [Paenibacillus sp. DMB20]